MKRPKTGTVYTTMHTMQPGEQGILSCQHLKKSPANEIMMLQNQIKNMESYPKRNSIGLVERVARLGVWECDLETGIYTGFGFAERLMGLTGKQHPLIEDMLPFIHPEDREEFLERHQMQFEGKGYSIEFRLIIQDKVRYMQSATEIVTDDEGRPIRSLGFIQEITKKKLAQRLLQESEMRKAFVIKNAELSVWVWDLKTGKAALTGESNRLDELFPDEGIFVEEMLGKVHVEERENFQAKAYGLASGQLDHAEIEYRYPDARGGWTWLRTHGMVVDRDEHGKPTEILGFHQDITEQRNYERGLLEAKKITEEASQAKSLFLANMSHEIRTPMTSILGYLDLICDDKVSVTEREEYAKTMRRNGMHLLDLINDILDLSKIESGQMEANPDYAQTVPLIDNVVGPLETLANEKGISLILDYQTEVPEKIWTDDRFLRQILWNVIGNATKFTEEGGIHVMIEHLLPSQDETEEGKEDESEVLRICVQDTGCGIPFERLETIFEPFVQADSTVTRKFGGTGLGLAIARRQIEALNGTIRTWNNSSGGATFEIVHPLEKSENIPLIQPENFVPIRQNKEKETRITATTLQGIKILLAEDGMDNQRLISTILRKAGATIDLANNGKEAIDMVQASVSRQYDVILMDMQMPLLDGYAATSILRENKVSTPIIALTAHAMSGDRKKCLESGCDSYCTKPIRPQKLVTLISRYVQKDPADFSK